MTASFDGCRPAGRRLGDHLRPGEPPRRRRPPPPVHPPTARAMTGRYRRMRALVSVAVVTLYFLYRPFAGWCGACERRAPRQCHPAGFGARRLRSSSRPTGDLHQLAMGRAGRAASTDMMTPEQGGRHTISLALVGGGHHELATMLPCSWSAGPRRRAPTAGCGPFRTHHEGTRIPNSRSASPRPR